MVSDPDVNGRKPRRLLSPSEKDELYVAVLTGQTPRREPAWGTHRQAGCAGRLTAGPTSAVGRAQPGLTFEENPDFGANVADRPAAPSASPGPKVYVLGQVELDARQLADLMQPRGGMDVARGIIQHELGHVGLDHVTDPSQLRCPQRTPGVTDFGVGSRRRLAALGRGACVICEAAR